MSTAGRPEIGELLPTEVWSELQADQTAALIDVRTRPEWAFVGVPDLSDLGSSVVLAEWRRFPDMTVDPGFVTGLLERFEGRMPSKMFFICRSGARSLEAARAVAAELERRGISSACFNVAEGFEGDLDAKGHRGSRNGWKARGLAWRQT